jgi:hypothetical protein
MASRASLDERLKRMGVDLDRKSLIKPDQAQFDLHDKIRPPQCHQ